MMIIILIKITLHLISWTIVGLRTKGESLNRLHGYEVLKLQDILLIGQKDIKLPILDSYHWMKFIAFQRNFDIKLTKSSVVTPSLEVITVNGDGSERKTLLQHTHYYTGILTDDPQSLCTVSIDPDGVLAHIVTGEEEFIIEPAWRLSHKYLNSTDMIVYRKSEVKNLSHNHTLECQGSYGLGKMNHSKIKNFQGFQPSFRHRRDANLGNRKVCRVLLVADHYFYTGIGGGSIPSTQNYMINVISQVNEIFKKTSWGEGAIGLGLEISKLIVHESSSDAGFNMKSRSMTMEDLLKAFGKAYYSQHSQYCLMHLLTFSPFNGKLGLAYVASSRPFDWGGMCSNADTWSKEALNVGLSSFMDPEGNRQLSIVSMSTVAHEIGHNWGSNHDPDTDECSPSSGSGGRYLMFSKALKGVARNNIKFSPCSTRSVYKVLSAKGDKCLTEPREGVGLCGNGRIDIGEACDPGSHPDGCCDSTCQLAGDAVCSPMNFACCTGNCKLASNQTECHLALDDDSDCLGVSRCNGIDFICPQPPPKSNQSCIDNGVCQGGVCVGFCERHGQLPCVCSDESGNSCKQCCKKAENLECTPYPGAGALSDGQICVHGFCKQGTCVKSSLPAERLWKVVLQQIRNSFDEFMRNNIVFFVTLFTLIVYIPAAILVGRYDKKEEETDRRRRGRMTKKSKNVLLNGTGEIREILNPISVAARHRLRTPRTSISQHHSAGPSPSSTEVIQPSHQPSVSQPYLRRVVEDDPFSKLPGTYV
ncbi:ADAM 17-like protease [Saccostrea echinata]|uniref:ADAM 17-like protease n=1 Tax=Saccostrea echinata TaxID=191078 RepID=UPI002A841CE8|nr:ADAM 17-like protease [Saccostrea echinata]